MYQSSHVHQDCTNSVPTMYQSSKTVKNCQKTIKNSKNDHWCTNRDISTKTVPIVACLHRVRRIHKVRVRVRLRVSRPRSRPPNTQSPYRSSIDTIALNCLVFEKIVFLAFWRQTDKQTDEQMDSSDALSRSRCRE